MEEVSPTEGYIKKRARVGEISASSFLWISFIFFRPEFAQFDNNNKQFRDTSLTQTEESNNSIYNSKVLVNVEVILCK